MAAPLVGRAAGAAAGRTAGRASVPKATKAPVGASAPVDAQPATKSAPKPQPGQSKPKPATPAPAGPSPWRTNVSSTVDNGAGFLLAVLVWGWVVMPFLRGGKNEVANVLRAKFVNQAADGSWLP